MSKKLGLLLLSLVIVVGLAGCGGADKKETATKEPVKVLRVGVSPDFSPFEFKDEKGKMVGFDVELMEALAKQMDRKLEFQDMAWDGLIPGVLAGRCGHFCDFNDSRACRNRII